MTKVTRFCLLAAVVVAISALAPNADAKCGVNKNIGNYPSAGTCGYYCQMTDPGVGLGTIKGDYWVIGAGNDDVHPTCSSPGLGTDSGNYEADGTCGAQGWLAQAGPNLINIGINTDAGNTDGCPLGGAHVAVSFSDTNSANTGAFFGVGVCTMNAAGNCDMGLSGESIVMAPIPKPQVTFTSKAGTALTLGVAVPAALPPGACVDATGSGHCPGGAGIQVIAGWDVYRFERPRTDSTTDNVRTRTAWTQVGAVGPAGGPVTFSCTDAVNANARLGLVPRYESGFKGDFVGQGSTRVECNPTLADPSTKYKIIDKKPNTTKTPVKQ
jgi:hypothetical protein